MNAFLTPAPAIFIGWQVTGFDTDKIAPLMPLFNLTRDIPGHPAKSTVTARTLVENGFAVDDHFTQWIRG